MSSLFYLAPLRGITDVLFRNIVEKHFGQFDVLVTPFITSVKGREVKATHLRDVSGDENDRSRVVPQMLGNDSEMLLTLADTLYQAGYGTVNLNLGCPHPTVTRKRRGSGLLPYPEIVEQIIADLCHRGTFRLSVKVRTGLASNHELKTLFPVLNKYPLSEVIVHARTGEQGYTGAVDLDCFTEVVRECCHPVVYNGDVKSPEDFVTLRETFPNVSRWMIGRGVVEYPFLLDALRKGTPMHCDANVLRAFHEDLFTANAERLSGPSHLLGKMKEFWSYFCMSFREHRKVVKSITRSKSLDEYHRNVDTAFNVLL